MTLINGAVLFTYFILFAALVLALIRLALGPTLPDRVVGLDLIATIIIGIIAGYTILTKEKVFLNPAVVLALISFLGTVAFAKYLEKRGA
ncbi:MAG: monovalent cation/H+ antiporter complex subunit F [Candidatus Anammoxibacter sp.]